MSEQEVMEITDEDLEAREDEFLREFQSAFLPGDSSPERMQSILKQAKLDLVLKDTTDFMVESLGRGTLGIIDAMIGMTEKEQKPRRRSF